MDTGHRPIRARRLAVLVAVAFAANAFAADGKSPAPATEAEWLASQGLQLTFIAEPFRDPVVEARAAVLRARLRTAFLRYFDRAIEARRQRSREAAGLPAPALGTEAFARWFEAWVQALLHRPPALKDAHLRRIAAMNCSADQVEKGLWALAGLVDPAAPRAAANAILDDVEATLAAFEREGTPPVAPPDDATTLRDAALLAAVEHPEHEVEPLPAAVVAELGRSADDASAPDPAYECLAMGWWARHAGREDATRRALAMDAQVVATWQDILASFAEQRLGPRAAGDADDDYPAAARWDAVEGVTRVEVVYDEDGVPVSGRVVDRQQVVPGLEDRPSVVFAKVFDASAIAQALKRRFGRAPPGTGDRTGRVDIVWKLQADVPAPR